MYKQKTNEAFVILFIIFFYPFGLPYMWLTKAFTKKTRWIVTISFLAAIIIGLASLIIWTISPGYEM